MTEKEIETVLAENKKLEATIQILNEMLSTANKIAEIHERNMDFVLRESSDTLTVRDRFLLSVIGGDFANPAEGQWLNETPDDAIDRRLAFFHRVVDRIMESRRDRLPHPGAEGGQA